MSVSKLTPVVDPIKSPSLTPSSPPSSSRSAAAATKVFIYANPDFYIDALINIFAQTPAFEVVSCVNAGDLCWRQFDQADPEVLMVHGDLITDTYTTFFDKVRRKDDQLKIIVFGHGMDVAFLRRLLRAGIHGYINENMTGEHLLKAITYVKNGGIWAERQVLEALLNSLADLETQAYAKVVQWRDRITNREADVLCRVVQGCSTREISQQLGVSEQSIKMHLGNLFKKFNVANRSQLILSLYQEICPFTSLGELFVRSIKA